MTLIPIWRWGRESESDVYLPAASLKIAFLHSPSSRGAERFLPQGEDATTHRSCQGTEIQSRALFQNTMTELQAGRWELDKTGGNSNLFCSLSMDSADGWEMCSYLFLAGLPILQGQYCRTSPAQKVLACCHFSLNDFPLSLVKSPFLSRVSIELAFLLVLLMCECVLLTVTLEKL